MLDVQPADVRTVEMVGEHAGDVGVDVGDREDHVGRVAVRHDEPRVRKRAVEVFEEQDVRRGLQSPRLRGLAPLQQLQDAALVQVRRGEIGVEQPGRVRRDLRERLVDVRLEVERHEIEALHRPVDVVRDVRLGAGLLAARGDARIGALDGRRRRARL